MKLQLNLSFNFTVGIALTFCYCWTNSFNRSFSLVYDSFEFIRYSTFHHFGLAIFNPIFAIVEPISQLLYLSRDSNFSVDVFRCLLDIIQLQRFLGRFRFVFSLQKKDAWRNPPISCNNILDSLNLWRHWRFRFRCTGWESWNFQEKRFNDI